MRGIGMAIVALALGASPAFAQVVSCRTVGNQTYCTNGQNFQRNGNQAYDNRGNSWKQLGGQIHGSDGSVYNKSGNRIYDNNGNSWLQLGNRTYRTGGQDCRRIPGTPSRVVCN